MNNRIKEMRDFFVIGKKQKKYWSKKQNPYVLAQVFADEQISDVQRAAKRLIYVLNQEQPVVFPGEKIAFTRTITTIPEIYTEYEMEEMRKTHWIHEKGDVCNINVDYTKLMSKGLKAEIDELRTMKDTFANEDKEKREYVGLQIKILESILNLAKRYREKAEEIGNEVVARTLSRIPEQAPENFLEALQMFRIIHFAMWCGRNYHNTIGRFDQYMYPYFMKDIKAGIYDEDSALELLEEFFLTFNRDSDLYPGMQQGDNGQSLVLGGLNVDGSDSYNLLSELCMKASLELRLIDPKINLRVHNNTPTEVYVLGTKLTKQGLGFPQYSNDDVVIPGLIELGYEKEDAYNYVVAACWEFIIPGKAMDIPNIEGLSFVKAVQEAVMDNLTDCNSYGEFEEAVNKQIDKQVKVLIEKVKDVYIFPAPFISLMMEGCREMGSDISLGAKYNNYGFHGTGIATAADSMSAIKKYIFEKKYISSLELIKALKDNFQDYDELRNKLRYEAPKMGNNDDFVDQIAVDLLAYFSEALRGKENDRGGIYRPGTGSAMYYIWHSKEQDATPDGRQKGEGLGCNYSPSLFSRCKGPVSIMQSFTKADLSKTINGGPLTLELHDTMFRSKASIEKTALMVRSFMDFGGHQLQLNAVNKDMMLDAQKHPENYRNLIVRVWGWSGYFVELDKEYQDHIIQRMELVI